MLSTRPLAAATLAVLALAGVACSGGDGGGDGRFTVAAGFYPIEQILDQVAGDTVDVVALVPPGEEAHEYEPTAQQLTALEKADLVAFLGGGFQPNLEKAIESLPSSVTRLDLLDGLTLLPVTDPLAGTEGATSGETLGDGNDPHVWLDPAQMQAMTDEVVAALTALAPDQADAFRANGDAYIAELGVLRDDFSTGLQQCESDALVTTHRAFGYLAAAFGLRQVAIAGISPSEEPSAKTLEAVADFARANGVTTIFAEENLPPDLADTVAGEVGATTAVLDPVESPSRAQLDAGDDYVSMMRDNLTALRNALRCT